MTCFRPDGHLTDAALTALVRGDCLEELDRLELAEHLAYCDQCLQRYTELLSEGPMLTPARSCRESLRRRIRQRAVQLGRVLHGNRRARHAARFCLMRDLLIRHQTERLSAEFGQRHLADARQRHIGIGHDRCARRKRLFRLFDCVFRKAQVVGIVKIRRRVDNTFDHLGYTRREGSFAQFLCDDFKAALFYLGRRHASIYHSIPSLAVTPLSKGWRYLTISVI